MLTRLHSPLAPGALQSALLIAQRRYCASRCNLCDAAWLRRASWIGRQTLFTRRASSRNQTDLSSYHNVWRTR
jgi:hypothetical protein